MGRPRRRRARAPRSLAGAEGAIEEDSTLDWRFRIQKKIQIVQFQEIGTEQAANWATSVWRVAISDALAIVPA